MSKLEYNKPIPKYLIILYLHNIFYTFLNTNEYIVYHMTRFIVLYISLFIYRYFKYVSHSQFYQ